MVTIKFNKKDNEISMARMSVEDDLIERNSRYRFSLSSKRKLQGIISLVIIVVIIVGFSVIKHKRSISSQYDNERYYYFFKQMPCRTYQLYSETHRQRLEILTVQSRGIRQT